MLIQESAARGITIIRGNITKNHVHILVSCPPLIATSKMMQYSKIKKFKNTTRRISNTKEKIFVITFLSLGYFCRSVGTVTQDIKKSYIEDQTDDIEKTFKITK